MVKKTWSKNVLYFSRLVSNNKISEQDYNLSVFTYVDQEDVKEKLDIVKLNSEKISAREQILRNEIDKIIKEIGVKSRVN